MIAIVDYGSGNIQAIANIYKRLNVAWRFASAERDLVGADKIILPGVGAFDQAAEALAHSGIRDALDRLVLVDQIPVLGICVGMQLLAERSDEGDAQGLGWIRGAVRRFDHGMFDQATHLPHMGWNTVQRQRASRLLEGADENGEYYFLHSYYFDCADPADVLGTTVYGGAFASVIQKGNVTGVQFHPEKSHQAGILLLRNFAAIEGC